MDLDELLDKIVEEYNSYKGPRDAAITPEYRMARLVDDGNRQKALEILREALGRNPSRFDHLKH